MDSIFTIFMRSMLRSGKDLSRLSTFMQSHGRVQIMPGRFHGPHQRHKKTNRLHVSKKARMRHKKKLAA